MENLAMQGQIDGAIYGFKLSNGLHDGRSIMTLGQPDPELYTEMHYVDVSAPKGVLPGMWFIQLHKVGLSLQLEEVLIPITFFLNYS